MDGGAIPTSDDIVKRLGGHKHHGYSLCKCPAHDDQSPSLSVRSAVDGIPRLHCFVGCTFQNIVQALQSLGIWPKDAEAKEQKKTPHPLVRFCGITVQQSVESYQWALGVWDKARSARATLVETYLRSRGIRLPISDQLRFAPRLFHRETNQKIPAMVARLSDETGFCAVQRTFLANDGTGKAPVPKHTQKMTLGGMRNAAVRFRQPSDILGLAEGIETALSASVLYSLPVWATCSAHRLSQIEIPKHVKEIIIFGDSKDQEKEQAFKAQDAYEARGLKVQVIFPAAHFACDQGDDFNDVLKKGAARNYAYSS